ncbi:kinase-like domain-containing protein [Paraphoma chrysanthemicola]|nr:kinase-like domain-containing protein [Paraphoma chrysanthemicola]
MSARHYFEPIGRANQVAGGCNNVGVYVVRHRVTNKRYIEKRYHPSDIDKGNVHHEIRVMQQLRGHPNVIEIVNYDLDYSQLSYGSVFMQRAELGSLDAVIKRYADRDRELPDEGFAWKVLYDISIALAFLWTGTDARTAKQKAAESLINSTTPGWNAIIHRDIKPSNVFMTWKDPLQIDTCPYPTFMLGDFGSAVSLSDGRARTREFPGNDPYFAPPEYPLYSEKGDIYSIGLVVICLAFKCQRPPRRDFLASGWASPGMQMVLEKCLMRAVRARPTPEELPKLVWLGYQMWCQACGHTGIALPAWAYGG